MKKNIKSGLKKILIQKFTKLKYMNQVFRFCCSCTRLTLVQKGKCYFCNSKFIDFGVKDRLIDSDYAETY